jgi:hypothetical protein
MIGEIILLLLVGVAVVWSVVWKGVALWRAAIFHQRNWFIALLILNTMGILELVYLFVFAKRKMTMEEIRQWFQKNWVRHRR